MKADRKAKYYGKAYHRSTPIPHFAVLPSGYVQRMHSLALGMGKVPRKEKNLYKARKGLLLKKHVFKAHNLRELYVLDKESTASGPGVWLKAVSSLPHYGTAKVRYERGKPLSELLASLPKEHRHRLAERLADLAVDHLRLGVMHGDLSLENVLVSIHGKRPEQISVRAIDYEDAELFTRTAIRQGTSFLTQDYDTLRNCIMPLLAKTEREQERLKMLFERRFMQKINGL